MRFGDGTDTVWMPVVGEDLPAVAVQDVVAIVCRVYLEVLATISRRVNAILQASDKPHATRIASSQQRYWSVDRDKRDCLISTSSPGARGPNMLVGDARSNQM